MEVNGFQLVNEGKVRRVIEGVDSADNHRPKGGLGNDADPALVLAHYDKIGGLILHNGNKVKMGSFWDFKAGAPRPEPKVVFEYRSESGDKFEFVDEEPVEVKAAKAKKKKVKKTDE